MECMRKPQVKNDVAFIKDSFSFLIKAITKLEGRVHDSVGTLNTVFNRIRSISGCKKNPKIKMAADLLNAVENAFSLLEEQVCALKNGIEEKSVENCIVLCSSYNLCEHTNLANTRLIQKHRNIKQAVLDKIRSEIMKERSPLLERQSIFEAVCEKVSKERRKIDELLKIAIAKCGIEPLLVRTEDKMSVIEMVEIFQDFERRMLNEYLCRSFLLQKAEENVSDDSFDRTWQKKSFMFIDDMLQVGLHLAKSS